MAIKDSIVNLKKGLRTTLTNVPALIDTLVRGLDGVEEEAAKGEVYSTSEKVVGTWIDGSEIYEKVVDLGALPNNTSKNVAHGISNLNYIISFGGTAKSGGTLIPIPYAPLTAITENGIAIIFSDANITITTGKDRSTYSGYIALRYIKSSASRSLEENDAKNNGNEEKNNNER